MPNDTQARYQTGVPGAVHPEDYIVNMRVQPSASYLVLHRSASFHIIAHSNPGAFTEHAYRKVCSNPKEEIERWITRDMGAGTSYSQICSTCRRSA